MFSVSKPRITYNKDLAKANVFRERFSALSDDEWLALWLSTEKSTNISDLEFPTVPDQELQLQIHGSASWEISMREAFDFYRFVKSNVELNANGSCRFLDYGCGWGRMARPFMRHFDLDKMFGFEPHLLLATIARSLNPYVCVLEGGYSPDGSIPKNWFELIVGWSIFSHLSRDSFKEWLRELSQVLRSGGVGVFTTWGSRFLQRLQVEKGQLANGQEIHWYSKVCIEAAGDISKRIAEYERGEFVWFTESGSPTYGEAFISELALRRVIDEESLPLQIVSFDTASLPQDVFLVRRV
jgi:SAM-dependent methyltransferase